MYLRIALPMPLRRLFDYLPPKGIDPSHLIAGVRVKVPFGTKTVIGILVSVEQKTSIHPSKLKQVLEILDEKPLLNIDVIKLCHWAADYYQHALGEVFSTALPPLLRRGTIAQSETEEVVNSSSGSIVVPVLNAAQQSAVDRITAASNTFRIFLLDGVTGSGKTEVYLQVITQLLQNDQQILVLVPEISLTPQTVARFRERFPVPIVTWHSNLSAKDRLSAWLAAKEGKARMVIGTRSAVFTSFANLGLIIVDEEHDASFKQQDHFRYHARDLAVMRAKINAIPIVLGSATASLESLLNVQRKRYDYLSLPLRAGTAKLPNYVIIDLGKSKQENGLSLPLLQMIRDHLQQHNQVMLFLNRRGYAPVYYCTHCAWIADCKRCDAYMVYHQSPPRLHCHHCDAKRSIPEYCLQCNGFDLMPIGLGTQKLEETLAQHFPHVPIIRMDRDSTRKKGSLENLLEKINTHERAILLGTQMLAKGHHFPHVTLVGIIDLDSGLFSADFRAAEQMGQLFMQVAGRAGRAQKPGTVVIQTTYPDHALLQTLINKGYNHFAEALLNERKQAKLPPYSHFAVIRAKAYKEENAQHFLNEIKLMVTAESVDILGPISMMKPKRKGLYCQYLLLKAISRKALHDYLQTLLQKIDEKSSNSVNWTLDIDPVDLSLHG